MTNQEAMAVLDKYRNWNTGQTSIDLAFHGKRTSEDDLLDARRKLMTEATKVLAGEADEGTNN